MITLSNGRSFEYVTASGALGYDGKAWPWEKPLKWFGLLNPLLFANVMKTITLQARRGNFRRYNPLGCIRPMHNGTINSVGLTNPGFNWWVKKIGSELDCSRIRLIGSIFGEPKELETMAKAMNDFDIIALEINASCPNTEKDISNVEKIIQSVEAVKNVSSHPVLLKVSVAHDIEKIVPPVKGMVEALDINAVPWQLAFPDRKSPLAKLGGGAVSGKIAQPFTWALTKKLIEITDVPVIGPSVWDFEDIAKLRAMGAKAVSFGSVFLCHPWRPTLFVKKDKPNPTL